MGLQTNLGFAAGRYFANVTFGGDSREKGTKVITGMYWFVPEETHGLTPNQISSSHSSTP